MERRSFRQWGQLMVGATLALIAIGIAWAMLTGGMDRTPTGVAWLVLLLALSYAVFVRPCVVVGAQGVTLRNIVRDVEAPWPAVAGAHAGWNLELETTAGKHSAWAISGTASPGRDALLRRSAAGVDSGGPGAPGTRRPNPGHVDRVDAAGVHAGLTPPATGASAAALAALIERERATHLEHPVTAGAEDAPVRITVAWLPVALVLAASAAVFLTQAF